MASTTMAAAMALSLSLLSFPSLASGYNLRNAVTSHNESGAAHFLTPVNLHAHGDPKWDKKSVQSNDVYHDDFVGDDRPTINTSINGSTALASGSASSTSSSGSAKGSASGSDSPTCPPYTGARSADWYKNRCAAINADCRSQEKHLKDMHAAKLKALEDEYDRQKRILDGKEQDHANAKDALEKQSGEADEGKMSVDEAEAAVKKDAHCPGDLEAARAQLAKLQASPNMSPEDIEEECTLQKNILDLMKCVTELREAEDLLQKLKRDAADAADAAGAAADAADAARKALTPQQKRVADAKSALDDASRDGPAGLAGLQKRCQRDKDALMRFADGDVSDAEAEYLKQKRILEGKKDNHKEEQADVEKQDKEVAEEKMHVKEARIVVQENINAPEDLHKAQAELAELEAAPNQLPDDIEAECEAKKRILDAEVRVAALWEAQGVLSKEKGEHADEKEELAHQAEQEKVAAKKLPPQQTIVDCAKKALDEAQAAKKALQDCQASDDASQEAEQAKSSPADRSKASNSSSQSDSAKDAGKKSAEEETASDTTPAPDGAQKRPNNAFRAAGLSVAISSLALATALL